VTTEEAQQAQDVVLGMFLASSHPATVLFYSGASHSFISSTFVAKHHLSITIMNHTNPIILSMGIDTILAMDWLRKYDGVILCSKRSIRLTKEDGTIVEFNAAMQADQASTRNLFG
jgi:hypothetical protein